MGHLTNCRPGHHSGTLRHRLGILDEKAQFVSNEAKSTRIEAMSCCYLSLCCNASVSEKGNALEQIYAIEQLIGDSFDQMNIRPSCATHGTVAVHHPRISMAPYHPASPNTGRTRMKFAGLSARSLTMLVEDRTRRISGRRYLLNGSRVQA